MATTPRPYTWKEAQLISDTANETGATFHFYDTNAQMIYPNSGLKYKYGEVPDGHWEDLELSEEGDLESTDYEFLKGDHPATGSLYMIGLRRTSSHDTLYLFRYDYMRDMSSLVENAIVTMQSDNPISQITASVKNVNDKLFTKDSSLFVPSSKLIVGIAYGKSTVNTLVTGYADEITWKYGKPSVSITGRNTVGYLMNAQTFDENKSFSGTAKDILEQIFERFGVTKYEIDDSDTKNIEFDISATDTGMKALQIISDLMSDIINDKIWDTEEMYDGHIICGYSPFRSTFNPKGDYIFNGMNDVFSTDIVRSIDGTYSHVMVVGTSKNGDELRPVIAEVTSRKFWTPSEHRTYHAPRVDGITQAELEKYCNILAKQLKEGGQTMKYQSTLRPQLLIGDVAKVHVDSDEESEKLLGIVTEIRHTLGVKGFLTEFTAATGGDIQLAGNKVYTTSKGINGSNRTRRVSDFITNPTETKDTALNAQPASSQPRLIRRGWAEFDGSDYIRLGKTLQSNYEVRVEFSVDQNVLAQVNNLGVFGTASGVDYQCLVAVNSGVYKTSTGHASFNFQKTTAGRHKFKINTDLDTSQGEAFAYSKFDEAEVSRYWGTTLSTYGLMYLGWCEGTNKFVGRIYSYQILDNTNGNVIMDLVPMELAPLVGESLKTGLYDTVSKVFYNCDGMTIGGY